MVKVLHKGFSSIFIITDLVQNFQYIPDNESMISFYQAPVHQESANLFSQFFSFSDFSLEWGKKNVVTKKSRTLLQFSEMRIEITDRPG